MLDLRKAFSNLPFHFYYGDECQAGLSPMAHGIHIWIKSVAWANPNLDSVKPDAKGELEFRIRMFVFESIKHRFLVNKPDLVFNEDSLFEKTKRGIPIQDLRITQPDEDARHKVCEALHINSFIVDPNYLDMGILSSQLFTRRDGTHCGMLFSLSTLYLTKSFQTYLDSLVPAAAPPEIDPLQVLRAPEEFDTAKSRAKADEILVKCWGQSITSQSLLEMHGLLQQALTAIEEIRSSNHG